VAKGSVTIRPLGPGDGLDALGDLAVRAFGPMPDAERQRWLDSLREPIHRGDLIAVFDGARLVAAAQLLDMVQWWHGRGVPMAGVAGVMVAPEDRGRGTGRTLMTAVLAEVAGRGYPLSVLHPATMALYRSLGWEIAGAADMISVPARSLRSLVAPDPAPAGPQPHGLPAAGEPAAGEPAAGEPAAGEPAAGEPAAGEPAAGDSAAAPVPAASFPAAPGQGAVELRRAGPADAAAVIEVIGGVHRAAGDCGPITRDEASVRRSLEAPDSFSYLASDGFLSYRWEDRGRAILVHKITAGSAAVARALWSVVASHSSIARTVRARLGPTDPLWWLTPEPDMAVTDRSMWMLRVADAVKAVGARGFPAGVTAQARLKLVDAACPVNTGCWQLTVGGGQGSLRRCPDGDGAPPLTLGARGFAALFAGTPAASLRRAGLAAGGDPGADAVLDAAFAATPFLLDYF
jgi:predicted acetyltransferase